MFSKISFYRILLFCFERSKYYRDSLQVFNKTFLEFVSVTPHDDLRIRFIV